MIRSINFGLFLLGLAEAYKPGSHRVLVTTKKYAMSGMEDGTLVTHEDIIVAKGGTVVVEETSKRPHHYSMSTKPAARHLKEQPLTLQEEGWTFVEEVVVDGTPLKKFVQKSVKGEDAALHAVGVMPDTWTLLTDMDERPVRILTTNSLHNDRLFQEMTFSKYEDLDEDFTVENAAAKMHSIYHIEDGSPAENANARRRLRSPIPERAFTFEFPYDCKSSEGDDRTYCLWMNDRSEDMQMFAGIDLFDVNAAYRKVSLEMGFNYIWVGPYKYPGSYYVKGRGCAEIWEFGRDQGGPRHDRLSLKLCIDGYRSAGTPASTEIDATVTLYMMPLVVPRCVDPADCDAPYKWEVPTKIISYADERFSMATTRVERSVRRDNYNAASFRYELIMRSSEFFSTFEFVSAVTFTAWMTVGGIERTWDDRHEQFNVIARPSVRR